MRRTRFQYILGFVALFGAVQGSKIPSPGCNAQAWVRAPDLTPNAIIHGDTRVKISAECPAVEDVFLGLRFKERSFVKALRSREDEKRLSPEPAPPFDFSNPSPWASMPSRFANRSVEEAYEEVATNKDLWIVREEERLVFETTQPINMGSRNHGAHRDTVQDFSILVPSTNFPPALDAGNVGQIPIAGEIVHVEWIYEYFAQISFANGTTKEISAGLTAFQPLHDPAYASQGPTSTIAELEPFRYTRGNLARNGPLASYSIEISADSGLTFFAGKKNHVITAVVTRTGSARTFSAPLNVLAYETPDASPKWAAEYNVSENGYFFTTTSVLRATSDGDTQEYDTWGPPPFHQVSVIMPNSTADEIEANNIVTTTSAAFTLSVGVDDGHTTTFETYYQTFTHSLTITLETPRAEDEHGEPDDPFSEHDFGWGPVFEDDEAAWVPWEKRQVTYPTKWRSYSGRVPVVVHPNTEGTPSRRCLDAGTDMSGQVVLSDETGCEQRSLKHYLDEGARGPTFVDRSAIHELLAEDPAQRDLRAPILEPVVSSPLKGEELVYRYYEDPRPNKWPIYVGETWAKRVANKNEVSSAKSNPRA
ncbi:hypothetical protein J3R83DRAFT_10357 [Lanmaoa asiatica]|nr:hypothetical protein J3R83DRAFT_10357 [Lanmaoa asiatica]